MSELHTVWEPESTPEATSTGGPHTVSQGVKAWGPFHDGRFLVNVGHAEYTPTQALVLAAVISRAALEAGAAQAKHDQGSLRLTDGHLHRTMVSHTDWQRHDGYPTHRHTDEGRTEWAGGKAGAEQFIAEMEADQ